MMPYDTYRQYQAERAKSPTEVQRADEASRPARLGRVIAASWHHAARASRTEAIPGRSARPASLGVTGWPRSRS